MINSLIIHAFLINIRILLYNPFLLSKVGIVKHTFSRTLNFVLHTFKNL
jgi:hypothetical protein